MRIEKEVVDETSLDSNVLNDVNQRFISRREFIEGVIYGKVNGEFKTELVRVTVTDGASTTEKLVWQAVYYVNNTYKGSVSKSLLLQTGKYDRKDVFIEADGTAQQWANVNILNGDNEKAAVERFVTEANARGLKFRFKPYAYGRKNGGVGTGYVCCVDFAS